MTPWELSSDAISLLQQHCTSRVIVEFGSGYGTDRLVQAGFEVYAIESEEQWIRQAAKSTLHSRIENGWYNHRAVHEFLLRIFAAQKVGAVIIDGPFGRIGRWGILHHWRQINAAELILVDDVQRADESALAMALVQLTGREVLRSEEDGKVFEALVFGQRWMQADQNPA